MVRCDWGHQWYWVRLSNFNTFTLNIKTLLTLCRFEFARQLAQKGYNLMLISRSSDKLEDTKRAIQSELLSSTGAQIQIRTLAIDFTCLDIYDRVKAFLYVQRHSIYILVNNVGNAPSSLDYFLSTEHRLDPNINQKLITVNAIATTKMIELILPSMVEKGCGLLVNVGSMSSCHITPMISLYSATKVLIEKGVMSTVELISIIVAGICRPSV